MCAEGEGPRRDPGQNHRVVGPQVARVLLIATVVSPRIYSQVSLRDDRRREKPLQLELWEMGSHVLQQTPETPNG